MFDENGNYFLLLIENDRISKVIPLGKSRRYIQLKLESENPLLEVKLFFQNNEEPCVFAAGDLSPNTSVYGDNGVTLLRRANEVYGPSERFSFKDKSDKRLELSINFLKNVQGREDFVSEIKAKALKDSTDRNDDEAVYRCFYNSFKMYRLRDNILFNARLCLELVGGTPSSNDIEFISQLEDYDFSRIYIQLIKDAVKADFTLDRNVHSKWVSDAQIIFSANFLIEKGLSFLIRFAERINEKTIFVLSSRSLSWDEAGAMETWDALGVLRGNQEARESFCSLLK